MRSNPPRALIKRRRSTNVQYKIKNSLICVIRWSLLGDYSCLRESAQPRLKSRELRTMMAKANLSRTLVVVTVVVGAVAVALFGVGLRSAETQTTPSYYKVEDLGTLGGSRSWASAINDSGQVVGYSYLAGDQNNHAFLYKDAKMTDLGTLGGTSSEAKGINKSGQVVGWSDNSSGERRAFFYDSANGMKDLNDLIPADSGWTIHEARAINNNGQIAATGYKDGVGQHALLLSPTNGSPPPADDTQAPSPPTITNPQNNSYDTDGS